MRVERIMTKNVQKLTLEDTVKDALNMLTSYSFRNIPIVNNSNQLKGLLTDRLIQQILPSTIGNEDPKDILNTPITNILRETVTTCHPSDFVETIAHDFYAYNIPAMPVVSDHQLVGIVTQKDMLNTFIEMTGMTEPGSSIEIDIEDRNGVIYEIGKVFAELNIKIISISVYPNTSKPRNKIIVLRIQAMNPLKAIEKLKAEGFTVIDPMNPL